MATPKEVFIPDAYYHVFNKSVSDVELFNNTQEYNKFMFYVKKKLIPYLNFHAYCLMPNHFHFLVQVKGNQFFNFENGFKYDPSSDSISTFISRKIGDVCNAYAQYYNNKNDRSGSLFKNRFQRKRISDELYYKELILYIHLNPVSSGICYLAKQWKHSSYSEIISNKNSIIEKRDVVEWFGDIENFVFVHRPYEGQRPS